jgi:hypothetical protein
MKLKRIQQSIESSLSQLIFRSESGEIMDVYYDSFTLEQGSTELFMQNFGVCTLYGENDEIFRHLIEKNKHKNYANSEGKIDTFLLKFSSFKDFSI